MQQPSVHVWSKPQSSVTAHGRKHSCAPATGRTASNNNETITAPTFFMLCVVVDYVFINLAVRSSAQPPSFYECVACVASVVMDAEPRVASVLMNTEFTEPLNEPARVRTEDLLDVNEPS